jgi:hypothetical protein
MGRLRGPLGGAPLAVLPRVAERLAALLDGRLDAARRAAALDTLGRIHVALETFADAAVVVRELEHARRAAPAPHLPQALRVWSWRRR